MKFLLTAPLSVTNLPWSLGVIHHLGVLFCSLKVPSSTSTEAAFLKHVSELRTV